MQVAEVVEVVEALEVSEIIEVVDENKARFDAAAKLLDQAVRSGKPDPSALYLLAMAYKRMGKIPDARNTLRKINPPDADVWLQMGMLSLKESNLAQAETEFAKAFELNPRDWEACHNLFMTRLCLDQVEWCLAMVPQAIDLAPSPDQRRLFTLLQGMLRVMRQGPEATKGDQWAEAMGGAIDPALQQMTADDEERLLRLVRGLGKLDTALSILEAMVKVRPHSPQLQEAQIELTIVKARDLIDRAQWGEAERCLAPLKNRTNASRATMASLLNLLGCATCLNQDFDGGLRHLQNATKFAPNDARIHQNLALVHELLGKLQQSEPHWNRFFDLLDNRIPRPPGEPEYAHRLAFTGMGRLATLFVDKEKLQTALSYVRRAHQLAPEDTEMLERLFHLNCQLKYKDDARKALKRLRDLRPGDPQYELLELDLIDVRGLNDIDRMLTEIERIRQRYPNDGRVEARAMNMVGSVIPLIAKLCEDYTERLAKINDQVRYLPNYQINWAAVHDVMREMLRDFQKLRKLAGKCLPLVKHEEQKKMIRDLAEQIDQKIDYCRQMSD